MVLSYNHPHLTSRTLDSILTLSKKESRTGAVSLTDANIFLVHNGSESQNIKFLQEKYPQVQHLILEKNKGYTGGVNFGLRHVFCEYQWCFFLTNDCELITVGETPLIPALIAPQIYVRSTNKTNSIGGLFDPKKGELIHCRNPKDFEQSNLRKYVPGTAFLIHKKVFEDVGAFDESLFTYWEDVDFSQRALEKGYPLMADSSWQAKHGIGKTCHKDPLYTIFYFQRNRKRISIKYCKSYFEQTMLMGILYKDWLELLFKLVQKKRWQDLKLLTQVLLD